MTPTADGRICVRADRRMRLDEFEPRFLLIALKTGSYADIAFALPNISTY